MKYIVCKKWDWLWVALFVLILLAGIGLILQVFQPIDNFEKAMAVPMGILMFIGGGHGILYNLFGEANAEEIGTWIYGIIMFIIAVGFFGTLIIGGIVELIKIIF